MGKKSKEPVALAPYEPPTSIKVTKEQAGNIAVGEHISVHVSGEVASVRTRENYENGDKKSNSYELELKNVQVEGIEQNKADKALEKMKGKQ